MTHPVDRIINAIIRHRRTILLVTALLTACAGYSLTNIRVNNDPTSSLPAGLKEKIDYDNLQRVFSSPRTVLFIALFDSMTLTSKIDSMVSWGKRFDSLDGIDNVVHIGTVQVPVEGGFLGLSSDYVVSRTKKLSTEELRGRLRDSRALTGMLISDDESALSMIMDVDESMNQVTVISRVDSLYREIARTAPGRVYITGAVMYAFFIDAAMKRDFALLLPLCLLIVSVLLYAVFRRLMHVIAALAVTAVALVWTFGVMGFTPMEFSVVTSIIPIILFPIGVATAIHVFRTHARLYAEGNHDRRGGIQATFRELMNPIFLSAITTFAGFASFVFTRVSWTRTFGIFTSIGVVFALLLSILLLPIVLWYDRRPPRAFDTERRRSGTAEKIFSAYRRFIFNPALWIAAIAAVLLIGIIGFVRVRVEGNPIAMFPSGSNIRRSDAIIEKYLGGTRFLFILLTHKNQPLNTAAQWEQVQRIIDYADSNAMVGGVMSLLPLINKVSTALSGVPVSEAALTMLLKSQGLLGKKFESYLRAWITPDRRSTKIALICKNVTGTHFLELSRSLTRHISRHFPDFDVLVAGPPVLNDVMTYVLIETQASSLAFAFIFVFCILCLLFRSIKVGSFAIVPIILSTLTVYALMGFTGVAINAVTVIIVNTCVGIGIDYSIHFTAGYLIYRKKFRDRTAALVETARIKGTVILFNTFVVGIGFLVLALSTFPPIRDLGIFVFVSMATSSVFALLFLPILFKLFGTGKTPALMEQAKE